MKRVLILFSLILVTFSVAFGVSLICLKYDFSFKWFEQEPVPDNINDGVASWLQYLCDKDYEACDACVTIGGFKLTDYNSTSQAVFNTISKDIYYQFLDFAVDSLKDVKIINIQTNSDGFTEYLIEVQYTPYKKIYDLEVDEARVTKILDDFVNERVTSNEYEENIQAYYVDLFKACFVLDNDVEVQTKTLKLSEKASSDGVVYVYDTKKFIQGLISDEMYKNLDVYQDSIKAKVDTVLRQY